MNGHAMGYWTIPLNDLVPPCWCPGRCYRRTPRSPGPTARKSRSGSGGLPDTVVRYMHDVVWRKPDVGLWPLSLWIMSPHHILEAGGEELRRVVEFAAVTLPSVIVAALQAAGTRDRL